MRSTPFALVFEPITQDHFPKIRSAAGERGIDVLDRDAFLLLPDVVTLLFVASVGYGAGRPYASVRGSQTTI